MSEDFNLDKMEYSDEYFEYSMQHDGTWCATAYNTTERFSVPREFQGKPVTCVAGGNHEPPSGRNSVLSVKLSPGLREIGYQAFFDFRGLKVVNIPATVEEIEACAFGNCVSLEGITVGRNVVSIRNEVFRGCKALRAIKLPDGLVSIGDLAFLGCESLEKIKIPRLVNHIGELAFSHCESLSSIEVDEQNAFFTSFCGVLFSKNMEKLIKYPASAAGSNFLMPERVRTVCDEAFLEAKKLKRIFISDNLEKIEGDCFVPLPDGTEPKRIASYVEIGNLYGRIEVFARVVKS